METTIYTAAAAEVIQQADGNYRVMSRNNICLGIYVSPVHAIEYADWFTAKKARA